MSAQLLLQHLPDIALAAAVFETRRFFEPGKPA